MQSAQTGLQLSQQIGDRESEGQIYNDLGLITAEQNQTNQARDYFEKSLLIAQETGDRRLEAQNLNNMGMISGMDENDYTAARMHFEKMLEIVQEIGNRVGECHALGNLGWVASMQGAFGPARVFQEDSLTIARETGHRYQDAYTLINLSAMLVTQENYVDSLGFAIQALDTSQSIGDRSAEAWALTYLGYTNSGLGNHNEAMNSYQKALDIRRMLNQPALAMEPLAGLAQIELSKDNPSGALSFAEDILSHLKDGGNLEGTEEPLRIYLTLYLTLVENHDSRANQVLEDAHSLLTDQVGKIKEESHKNMFIQNVPWRRKIEELWLQSQEKK
jgi:tetratricopeptide (TPR) repeat protein